MARLFISHAWDYNDAYYRLLALLKNHPTFVFYNHSVPEHDPLDFKKVEELRQLLKQQMQGSQVVLVIAGMYVYRQWIQEEIEMAVAWEKPIIGVRPYGSTPIPKIVQDCASDIVGWNTASIVTAIKKYVK